MTPQQPRDHAGIACASLAATTLVVCWLVAAMGVGPAAAHASLVGSSPADGSTVATAPKKVTLTFDETMRMPSVIVVSDADGTRVTRGRTSVIDNIASVRVGIRSSGNYIVVFRVVSADGHPVSGRVSFTVGNENTGGAAGNDASSGPPTRALGMLAALALFGGVGLLTVRRWAPNLWSSS
jgi:methionine-rich copper-binding protein CopC